MKLFTTGTLGLLFIALFTFSSCEKEEDTPGGGSPGVATRLVKYEITGNFTGQVDIAYTNASGATESVQNVSLPWTLEFTAANNVSGVGFSANGSTTVLGSPGQTVQAKLYTGGVLRQTTTGTVANNGVLTTGTLTHVF